jgi:hypothetical protein
LQQQPSGYLPRTTDSSIGGRTRATFRSSAPVSVPDWPRNRGVRRARTLPL